MMMWAVLQNESQRLVDVLAAKEVVVVEDERDIDIERREIAHKRGQDTIQVRSLSERSKAKAASP
jgi:hypothetical protein